MVVPEDTPRSPRQQAAQRQRKQEASRHQQCLDTAQAHYVKSLKGHPPAIRYLKQRGVSGEIAARFGLGWSGTDRRGLATVFPNYEDPMLVECGLVIEADDGRRYDRFRERIMFPIRNARGSIIGFGGRIIGKGEPKYLNSPETPLFSKGHELYGLWEGRAGIRSEGFVLVVEGYMDVVALAQHGLSNAVATLGTATTEFHLQKLLRTSSKIVFSFDGDGAGRRAAWRALTTCLPLVRDDVSMRFLFLPAGHDPDSYIREFGEQAFRATVSEAAPLSRFLLDELGSRHAMDEPEGRAACVHEAAPLLAQLPDTTLRVQIQREFAQRVLLTPDELAERIAAVPRRQAPVGQLAAAAPGRHLAPATPVVIPPDPAEALVPDEPAGFMDDGPGDDRWHAVPDDAPAFLADTTARARRESSRGRARAPAPGNGARAVTPMAKRLLRLLLAHPDLVTSAGEQQLEILEHAPHLILVRELIALINSSGARHAGAVLQAAEPGSELALVVTSLASELLANDELPEPRAEWNDALRRIEIEAIKAEQSALIDAGLSDDSSRKRYQELTRRLSLINGVSLR
jgi:DNA primase